jgi:hypothetical protein
VGVLVEPPPELGKVRHSVKIEKERFKMMERPSNFLYFLFYYSNVVQEVQMNSLFATF